MAKSVLQHRAAQRPGFGGREEEGARSSSSLGFAGATRFVVEECAVLSNCTRLNVMLVLRDEGTDHRNDPPPSPPSAPAMPLGDDDDNDDNGDSGNGDSNRNGGGGRDDDSNYNSGNGNGDNNVDNDGDGGGSGDDDDSGTHTQQSTKSGSGRNDAVTQCRKLQ